MKEVRDMNVEQTPWRQTIGDMKVETPFVQISPDKAFCNVTVPFGKTTFYQAGK